MSVLNEILGASGGGSLSALAKQFGIGDDQAKMALQNLLPALSSGMKRSVQTQSGLDGLVGALKQGNHQSYLDEPRADDAARNDGNAILGHLLGSKEVSRDVAARAAKNTGLDQGLLKKMLPVVAGMFMGATSKQSAQLGLEGQGSGQSAGMLTKFLDADGDGSITDDLMGMAKKLF